MLEPNELYLTGLKVKWDKIERFSYLRKIAAIRELDELSFNTPVTFFVGENGSGKSTLLEAIAVAYGFNPEGGTLNYSFSTYDSHNVATAEEEYTKIQGIPQHYHEKSHGESFLSVIQKNFDQNGLYILDEPEAALSPQRQLTLLLEMSKCVKNDSQFIIVTHSPILLGYPNADILSFDEGAIKPISYEDTQSYQITKMFINDRRQILRHLFE